MSIPSQPAIFPALQRPYIFAHQGGELLAPTNTMAAFAVADALGGVDFLDIDVHMTRDGHLVGIHDSTVDRTTNGRGRVDSYTLADLQQLDAGYRFQNLQGEYSYRGKGVRIPALAEVFETYATKFYLHFEIKDTYPKAGPSQVEEKLWQLIQRHHMEKRTIVASFQQSIVRRFQQLSRGQAVIGAGRAEVTQFVLAHTSRLPRLYRRYSQVLEIPLAAGGMNLKKRSLIEDVHRAGMEVYYWTIDDVPTMKELIELGADGLFTNRPDLLKGVLQEMGVR
ncbi:MAG: glycerophosphodiester phosphodiesterase [Ktedonobacteraceae bacterium]|nr:glycerophosphodiester phosphodiesterase [Ktedonobacteraceae bacterium]